LRPQTHTQPHPTSLPGLLCYSYKLVDACGRHLERPTKHPFALSRVFYAPSELPAGEQQVGVMRTPVA